MKTILFNFAKGGTGKTSTAVTMAYELSNYGKTVIIDFDIQGNTTSWLLTPKKKRALQYDLSSYLIRKDQGQPLTLSEILQPTAKENLSLIPTSNNGNLKNIQEAIETADVLSLLQDLESQGFKYAVIDTSPNVGNLQTVVAECSNEIIPVVKPEYFGIDALTLFVTTLNEIKKRTGKNINFSKVVISIIENKPLDTAYTHSIREMLNTCEIYEIPKTAYYPKCQSRNIFIQQEKRIKPEILEEYKHLAESLK